MSGNVAASWSLGSHDVGTRSHAVGGRSCLDGVDGGCLETPYFGGRHEHLFCDLVLVVGDESVGVVVVGHRSELGARYEHAEECPGEAASARWLVVVSLIAVGEEDVGNFLVSVAHAAELGPLPEALRHVVLLAPRDQDLLCFEPLDQRLEGIFLVLGCLDVRDAESERSSQRLGVRDHASAPADATDHLVVDQAVIESLDQVLLAQQVLDDELDVAEPHLAAGVHRERFLADTLQKDVGLALQLGLDHIERCEEQAVGGCRPCGQASPVHRIR